MEYIQDKINKIVNNSCSNFSDLYKETEINKKNNLTHLFNYFIKDNKYFGLCLKSRNKIKWYVNNDLNFPIQFEESDSKIKEIYKDNYKLTNLSFFKSHNIYNTQEIYENSILFTQSLKSKDDIDDLVKILNDNDGKVKVIIVNEFYGEDSDLINFFNEKKIPIYTLSNNVYSKYMNFFIEGKGGNYIDIINNTSGMENSSSIVDIYKLNLNIKKPPHENKDDMDEMDENELKKYEENRIKKYNELIDDIHNFYNLGNIKIIKRLIYDMICFDIIQISELEDISNNMEDIIYILEVLIMEYYYNIKYSLSNNILKEKLNNYLKKISNQWIDIYFDNYFEKYKKNKNILSFNDYLFKFDIKNYNMKTI